MDIKRMHEACKRKCSELITEEFKKDLIDVTSEVYGEEHRQMFEKNMKRVIIHPILRARKEQETEQEKIDEKEIRRKQIENQKALLRALKSRLSEEDAEKLQRIIDEYYFNGSFSLRSKNDGLDSLSKSLESLDDKFDSLFGELFTLDTSVLDELVEKYGLYDCQESSRYETEIPEIREYWKKQSELEILQIDNNYQELLDELQGVDTSDLQLYKEYAFMNGSFVTYLRNLNTGELESHIFMEIREKDQEFMHTAVHELLHAMLVIETDIEGQSEVITGHNKSNDENDDRYTLLSEYLHEKVVTDELVPRLIKRGYDIEPQSTVYLHYGEKDGAELFYDTFKDQILRTACQDNIKELTDVVGEENWNRLAAVIGKRKNAQVDIVRDMLEYARRNLANRIGRDTVPEQREIDGKNKVTDFLDGIMDKTRRRGREN